MTISPLPPQDYPWVLQTVRTHIGAPELILLGGSRSEQAGLTPMASSDYDILAIAPYVRQPVSLTLRRPFTDNKFDMMILDHASLAAEFETGRREGYGTVLTLCHQSTPVYDPNKKFPDFQKQVSALYDIGPDKISRASVEKQLSNIKENLACVQSLPMNAAREISALNLAEQFGTLALRASGRWCGTGKILARLLEADMPEYKHELDSAYNDFRQGCSAGFEKLAKRLPSVFVEGHASYSPDNSFPLQPKSEAEAYYFCRVSSSALCHYLHHGSVQDKLVAKDWIHYRYLLTGAPVEKDRFSRKNGEYRYALARYVGHLVNMALFKQGIAPNQLSMREQAEALHQDQPGLSVAMSQALLGNPAKLHDMGKALLLDNIGQELNELRARPALPNRGNAAAFI